VSKLASIAVGMWMVLSSAVGLAATPSSCKTTLTGTKLGGIVVPAGKSCTIKRSTITGNVTVMKGAYFEADATQIHGTVTGLAAQTIFVKAGSRVDGSVIGKGTRQVLIYSSTIGQGISARGLSSSAQVCGATIKRGNLTISGGHQEVLIGDRAAHCAGNTLDAGSATVKSNRTSVFFGVISNRVRRGNLIVARNTGPSKKLVRHNVGGAHLSCSKNAKPFTGTPNGKWKHKAGQCR
jgi:hypothetical protein